MEFGPRFDDQKVVGVGERVFVLCDRGTFRLSRTKDESVERCGVFADDIGARFKVGKPVFAVFVGRLFADQIPGKVGERRFEGERIELAGADVAVQLEVHALQGGRIAVVVEVIEQSVAVDVFELDAVDGPEEVIRKDPFVVQSVPVGITLGSGDLDVVLAVQRDCVGEGVADEALVGVVDAVVVDVLHRGFADDVGSGIESFEAESAGGIGRGRLNDGTAGGSDLERHAFEGRFAGVGDAVAVDVLDFLASDDRGDEVADQQRRVGHQLLQPVDDADVVGVGTVRGEHVAAAQDDGVGQRRRIIGRPRRVGRLAGRYDAAVGDVLADDVDAGIQTRERELPGGRSEGAVIGVGRIDQRVDEVAVGGGAVEAEQVERDAGQIGVGGVLGAVAVEVLKLLAVDRAEHIIAERRPGGHLVEDLAGVQGA